MITKTNYRISLFRLIIYGLLFAFLQTHARFYFYYMEQNQQFQYTWYYLKTHLTEPAGGFSSVISGFLNSFFLLPCAGAAITAALLACAGWLTHRFVRRIAPQTELLPACLLPVIALMLIHLNANYLPYGTVAFILMLMALNMSLSIKAFRSLSGKAFRLRLIFHLLTTVVLFYIAGPVSMLYAVIVMICELRNGSIRRRYPVLLVLIVAFLSGVAGVYLEVYTDWRFAFLPDRYFHNKWLPGTLLYLSWFSLLLPVVLACLIRKMKTAYVLIQVVLVAGCCWWGIQRYGLREQSTIMEFDYYCRTEQWNKITERGKGSLNDYLSICYVNMALAQQGELGNKAFMYDQAGVEGLICRWDKSASASLLLSEIYFTMNNIALSQKMAFESFVITDNPRMLKRLVQTNLIYGAYPVAEKYISRLEQMRGYREWAKAHRRFLYNEPAIEQDEVLGSKRKSLVKVNYLSKIEGLDMDLQQSAVHNPADRTSIEYAGVLYLLAKDMERFRQLIESYYQTDILPHLPVSFQEAILILSLKEPDYWKQYDIPEATVQRFSEFIKAGTAQTNNPKSQTSIKSIYGHTYWYYYLFK